MILVSLRDLQFRRRRFLVGIAGTSLVLALTLVLAGVSNSFVSEARRTTEAFDAATWVVPDGANGPFLSSATLPMALADQITEQTGTEAVPVSLLRVTVPKDDGVEDANVIGVPFGTFADPDLREGRIPEAPGEIIVDDTLGIDLGARVALRGEDVLVVGRTHHLTFAAGVGNVYLSLADAQRVAYGGAPLASTIVTPEPVDLTIPGYRLMDEDAVRKDLLRPLDGARRTIDMVLVLLWIVAAMIVGSIVYLSALDRVRDFAVFKAMGAKDRSLFAGVAAQALLLSGSAYVVGALLSRLLGPRLPMEAEVAGSAYVLLAVVALVVAAVSSVAGIRRALKVDPALAFGGA